MNFSKKNQELIKIDSNFKSIIGKNKISTALHISVILLLMMLIMSCSSDDAMQNMTYSEGSMQELKEFYNDDFVDAMKVMGFTFNLGNTPPTIEGSYIIDPFILDYSTVGSLSGHIGENFGTFLPSFSNQNNNALTIDYFGQSGSGGQKDVGNGSFVMGSNGAFSVYAKNTTTLGNATAITAVAISGVLTPNGIENIQFLGAMLDDKGDPQQTFIANNTGSLYLDGDGLATKQ